MKKILCLALSIILALSVLALVSCNTGSNDNTDDENKTPDQVETLKMGLGVHVSTTATNADGDKNGQGNAVITVATVTVDKDGKIVACAIDVADNTVKYTYDGKAISEESFKTKYEMGSSYGMVQYAGSAKEWFEQADAFCTLVKGKTVDEVKALVVNGDKGNDDVIAAGCTITVNEFVLAIEKACKNAAESNATSANTLKLGIYTEQTASDADGDKKGTNEIETTIFACAVDADGKIVAAVADCVAVEFTFDANGASTYDATKAVVSKREAGDAYGMVQYAGSAKEWYAQADAFAAKCIGKKVGDVSSLMDDKGYGSEDVKGAGCTIVVMGFVKAASKIK
ncbi:MAG: hypothetical protein E7649_06390 [Ruminococcaceae bacterium]|nr:hypothetical protein [Oscillospiraceae bacterium]